MVQYAGVACDVPESGDLVFDGLNRIRGTRVGDAAHFHAWVSDIAIEHHYEYWVAARQHFAGTGCSPVLFVTNDESPWWDSSLLGRDVSALDGCSPLVQLGHVGTVLDHLAPPSPLVVASPPVDFYPSLSASIRLVWGSDSQLRYWLAVLPVARASDIPYHLGLDDLFAPHAEFRSCLLRSWEQRFGADLYSCGHIMTLLVSRPPDRESARQLRLELSAFAPDSYAWTGGDSEQEVSEEIVDYVAGNPIWTFWWD